MNVPEIRFKGFHKQWESNTIGEISNSYSGGTPSVGCNEFYGGNIPFIRSGEIYNDTTELYLTPKGLYSSSAKIVDKGTILYALYGATSGEVNICKIRGAINQAILAIIPKKNINNYYLLSLLRNKKISYFFPRTPRTTKDSFLFPVIRLINSKHLKETCVFKTSKGGKSTIYVPTRRRNCT